jgi:purine-cytosine permease-like protein
LETKQFARLILGFGIIQTNPLALFGFGKKYKSTEILLSINPVIFHVSSKSNII